MRKKRVKGLIRDLQRLLARHGNLVVTHSIPWHTSYQDQPIRQVVLLEQGRNGHLKSVDLS